MMPDASQCTTTPSHAKSSTPFGLSFLTWMGLLGASMSPQSLPEKGGDGAAGELRCRAFRYHVERVASHRQPDQLNSSARLPQSRGQLLGMLDWHELVP